MLPWFGGMCRRTEKVLAGEIISCPGRAMHLRAPGPDVLASAVLGSSVGKGEGHGAAKIFPFTSMPLNPLIAPVSAARLVAELFP